MSTSHSQPSSFDSSSHRLSPVRPTSSGLLDPSQGNSYRSIKTPSTSLSNKSSQERAVTENDCNVKTQAVGYGLEIKEHARSANALPASPTQHLINHSVAPKRMANGDIKSPAYSLPTSPVSPSPYEHSRSSTKTFPDSRIIEISTQLKTRLSYAMVKVQHGWESRNLGQLESLTSNQGSPTSTASEPRHQYANLITDHQTRDYGHLNYTSVHDSSVINNSDHSARQDPFIMAHHDYQRRNADNIRAPLQIGAAYESFWREHEGNSNVTAYHARGNSAEGPSLAPPVDILPRNLRRRDSLARNPPTLRTSDLFDPKDNLVPRTPSPKKPSSLRTPSQQAAVEKDAVESLLFMSSPSNSGYHPPVVLSGTPLRSEFAHHDSRPGVSGQNHGKGDPVMPISILHQEEGRSRKPLSDADVDKLLDAMSDTTSSDEGDPHDRPSQQYVLGS